MVTRMWQSFSFINIPPMGEAYFAWHNEFEGINNHQLRGMYYNWKSAFGTIFSHRGSTFAAKVLPLARMK